MYQVIFENMSIVMKHHYHVLSLVWSRWITYLCWISSSYYSI